MDLNFSAFQEPRGVMRILHMVFSICAFATITGYTGYITFECKQDATIEISYPFSFVKYANLTKDAACSASVTNDCSSDARFFVATGVLAMLYSLGIMFVYAKMDETYKTNKQFPFYDFLITVFLSVLWLASSAAWANGLTGLKTNSSNPTYIPSNTCCGENGGSQISGYSTLNISVIFGFLNFFLWSADLWFLYKETTWFQGLSPPTSGL